MVDALRDLEMAKLRVQLNAARAELDRAQRENAWQAAEIARLTDRVAWLEQRYSRLLDVDVQAARRSGEDEG